MSICDEREPAPKSSNLCKKASFATGSRGLLFAIAAPLFYVLKSTVLKLAPSTNLETLVFFRFFFDFLILSPFFIKYRKNIHLLKIHLHLFRAVLAALALALSTYGIKNLTLADSILLETTIPLFIPLIFWAWFRQRISTGAVFILLMGFFSLFLLLKPKLDILHLAVLAPLGMAFLTATTSTFIHVLSKTEHPIALLFYYYCFCGFLTFFPFIASWEGVAPSSWIYFVLISIFGVLFQVTNILAFRTLPIHVAGNFIYFAVFYGVLFDWLFWNASLSMSQILGGSLLILSGIFIARENKRLQLTELQAAKE